MIGKTSAVCLALLGSFSLVLGAYPSSYTVGYGFIGHGGIGPHGHYLPAVARVKVHKDPLQSHYSLDEEGPTHYKYIRHSSANPVIPPPLPLVGEHYPHHHHHHHPDPHSHHHPHHVAPIAAPAVPVHGGIIGAAGPPIPIPAAAAALDYGSAHYYNDYGAGAYGGFHHGAGAFY